MQWAGGGLVSYTQTYTHIFAPTNLQYKKQELMTEDNSVYETIWKKTRIKEIFNEKYIWFFTIWNVKRATMYKCGRVVLYRTSVCFCHIIFMYHALLLPIMYFCPVLSFPFFWIDHNRKQMFMFMIRKRFIIVLVKGRPSVGWLYKLRRLKRKSNNFEQSCFE